MEMAFFAVEYAKAKDVPVVIDIRDLWPDILADVLPVWSRPLGRVALLPFEMMAHRALSSCTAITAVSEGYLNWGLGKTARARSELDRVFPLGYSNPEDSTRGALLDGSDLRSRFGLEPDKLTVWFLGTFGQTYDLETVIGAASILAQSGAHDIQFVLSGDGEQRGALERKARNLKNVIFTDWVDRAGILSLMKVAGIGLAAYRVGAPQGISNKIIEYMAAGLPIVSSLRGEAEELIEQRKLGLNYEPGNCRSLANVLQTLGRDRALRMTFAANSRSEYDSHYRADTVYGKMADYLEFVARHGRGGLRREVNGG
jgi:glycosyltransferase involved in cell wall biosynthesis